MHQGARDAAEQEECEKSRGRELPALLKGFDMLALAVSLEQIFDQGVAQRTYRQLSLHLSKHQS
jgi:hypothetical protein